MAKKSKSPTAEPAAPLTPFSDALRTDSTFVLSELDPASTPGFSGSKSAAAKVMEETATELADLQERLFAESTAGAGGSAARRVLLVVQGMDTSGKGGIMRYVAGAIDPQGIRYRAFKVPTAEEREHPFLWRFRNALPGAGQVGVFDRSHYEDVLVVRVHNLVPRTVWGRRYRQINTFEAALAKEGITVIKVMLHISNGEQKSRLASRLERPDKLYKFNPADIDERTLWPDYMEAYQVAVTRCTTEATPWFVVPADHKWYARLAVHQLLLEHLRSLDPQWPAADFDVPEQRERLAAT